MQSLPQPPGRLVGMGRSFEQTTGSLINVSDFKLCGIELVARSHAADDGNVAFFTRKNEIDLRRDGIDGIDDVIVSMAEESIGVFRQVEVFDGIDNGFWVDRKNAVFHGIRLFLPDRLRRRMDLTVDVREADTVVVDEDDMANARTRKAFDSVRANATDTKDGNGALSELVHRSVT